MIPGKKVMIINDSSGTNFSPQLQAINYNK